MNTLREAVQSYLAMRRALGFKLLLAGNALQDFVTFMEKRRAVHITQRRALQWAQQPKHAQLATWAARLGYIRGFAQYYSSIDARTEIPPCGLMPYRPRRAKPYLYSSAEIEALLQAALTLSGGMGLRPWTYYCFLGLLSVSGLRLGEALDLKREDVDLDEGILTVRGKFGKIRMVPLHASTRQALADYVARRRRFLAGRPALHLFVSNTDRPLHRADVYKTFHALSRQIGLRSPTATHGPRLHDFRHRYASETLLRWYRNGEDVERCLPLLSTYLGHVGTGGKTARTPLGESIMKSPIRFSSLLQAFFTQRLMQQKQVSSHTIESYRDTFRLLLKFIQKRRHKQPASLLFEDIDAPLICAFLDDLQKQRGISARSRNVRLAAIRSFFHYAAFEVPSRSEQIQRVLAIPSKRYTRTQVGFLTRPEVDALLAAPDARTWSGRRDHALLLTAVQTGMRLSEMTGLKRQDMTFGTGAHVQVVGKGRKTRCTPLTEQTRAILEDWLQEPAKAGSEIVFPNARGARLSADGVSYILGKQIETARKTCPVLLKKRVTFHQLRHYVSFLTMS